MPKEANVLTFPLRAPASDYLGPARVVEAAPGRIRVELRDGSAALAELALALPYAPVVGDTLLVIGKGDEHWVIGVIQGSGRTSLELPGDVELTAVNGALKLRGDRGVQLSGPEVELRATTLRTYAETAFEKLETVYRRISGALNVRAKEAHTIIEETSVLTAKNASILTEDAMTINGKEIHLG